MIEFVAAPVVAPLRPNGYSAERSRAPRADWLQAERRLARRHPLGRWYLVPMASWFSARLARTRCRPNQVTLFGLLSAALAAALVVGLDDPRWAAAAALVAYALCDRIDGQLARLQGTASRAGAWIDAQVDELVDLGLHAALAARAAADLGASWPWCLWALFATSKYLLITGIDGQERLAPCSTSEGASGPGTGIGTLTLLRRLWHLPGNADLRLHALIVACLTGYGLVELGLVAGYYALRSAARWVWVPRRLAGGAR